MEKKVLIGRQLRERTLLLWMPLIMIALITMLFAGLGGGKAPAAAIAATGFLKRLPGAIVAPVTRLDKMGWYELAKRDSTQLRQRLSMQSSYARQLGFDDSVGRGRGDDHAIGWGQADGHAMGRGAADGDAEVTRIRTKLAQVRAAIGRGGGAVTERAGTSVLRSAARERDADAVDDVPRASERHPDRRLLPERTVPPATKQVGMAERAPGIIDGPKLGQLQRVMRLLDRNEEDAKDGSELHELTAVVEKLLALQRGQADTGKRGAAPPPHAVLSKPAVPIIAVPAADDSLIAFDSTRIEAIVSEETVLASGGEIRLTLAQDIRVGSQRVPAGTPLFGSAVLNGERLRIAIVSIAFQGRILPADFEVADEDGIPGIYIPGAPVNDALRESAGQELSSVGSGLLSTTLAGQAAGAGVVLARSLIGKKIRPVKVTIPEGYQVLLHVKNNAL